MVGVDLNWDYTSHIPISNTQLLSQFEQRLKLEMWNNQIKIKKLSQACPIWAKIKTLNLLPGLFFGNKLNKSACWCTTCWEHFFDTWLKESASLIGANLCWMYFFQQICSWWFDLANKLCIKVAQKLQKKLQKFAKKVVCGGFIIFIYSSANDTNRHFGWQCPFHHLYLQLLVDNNGSND